MSRQRPVAILPLAVITVAMSVSALLLIPGSLLATFFMPGPVRELARSHDFFRTWLFASAAIGWVACFVAIGGSVGIFYMKAWGRLLLLAWAVYAVLSTFASALVTVIVLMPALMSYDGPERSAALGGAGGGLFGSLIGLILPCAHLWILTRPHIKAAFDAPGAGGALR